MASGCWLSKNISGGTGSGYPNGLVQFKFDVAGNTNGGGNKANGVCGANAISMWRSP